MVDADAVCSVPLPSAESFHQQLPSSTSAGNSPSFQTMSEVHPSKTADTSDNLRIPAVLNALFGSELKTSRAPQPLNFSNSIPLKATIANNLQQKIWKNTYFDIRLLLPSQQEDNCSV